MEQKEFNWAPVTPGKSLHEKLSSPTGNGEACFVESNQVNKVSSCSPPTFKRKGKTGLKLDGTPEKRRKIVRHRPKVLNMDMARKTPKPKPVRTPKPRTPEPAIPKAKAVEKRKYVRKCNRTRSVNQINNVDGYINVVDGTGYALPSCKQKLDFNLENLHDSYRMMAGNSLGNLPNPLRTYRRRYWLNDCLKKSRRLDPKFPVNFKRKRMKHSKRTNLPNFSFSEKQRKLVIAGPLSLWCKLNLPSIPRKSRSKMRHPQKEFNHLVKNNSLVINVMGDFADAYVQGQANPYQMEEHELNHGNGNCVSYHSFQELNHGNGVSYHRCIKGTSKHSLKLIPREFPPNLERDYVLTSRDDTKFTEALINVAIERLESLSVTCHPNMPATCKGKTSVTRLPKKPATCKGKSTNERPIKHKKLKMPKILVDFDKETIAIWKLDETGNWNWDAIMSESNLLEGNKINGTEIKLLEYKEHAGTEIKLLENKEHAGTEIKLLEYKEHADRAKYWKSDEDFFIRRITWFLWGMAEFQGLSRFRLWKASVVDSIVGVYLTQNVSDVLSSSAFLCLAAKYPPPPKSTRMNATLCLTEETTGSNAPEPGKSTNREQDSYTSDKIEETTGRNALEPGESTNDEVILVDETNDLVIPGPSSCFNTLDGGVEAEGHNTCSQSPVRTPHNTYSQSSVKTNRGHNISSQFSIESNTGHNGYSQSKRKNGKVKDKTDWDELRRKFQLDQDIDMTDAVDWDAVRLAPVKDISDAIAGRGMNNILAEKIQQFLNGLFKDHGSVDLGWLRRVSPAEAKEYLLGLHGIGLKSTECVRLLGLHMVAFPVDVNVARVLVRFGWVPLQPLNDNVPFHLLNNYPDLDSVQKYIWPRLSKLPYEILYILHCQLIKFGKIFCTKKNENCEACPMKSGCKHYQSKKEAEASDKRTTANGSESIIETPSSPSPETEVEYRVRQSIETPSSEIQLYNLEDAIQIFRPMLNNGSEPTIDMPPSPERTSSSEIQHYDLEDFHLATNPIPRPMLNQNVLCTTHEVFVLPDSHHLLTKFDAREPGDPSPYLLAVWIEGDGDATHSHQSNQYDSDNTLTVLSTCMCGSGTIGCCGDYKNDKIVRGTILIPVHTATRRSFPLNGTYFQDNEVFADHETSINPILVPTDCTSRLNKSTLYCGSHITSITKGCSAIQIKNICTNGYICIRNFDRTTRMPQKLSEKFHSLKSKKQQGCKSRPGQIEVEELI